MMPRDSQPIPPFRVRSPSFKLACTVLIYHPVNQAPKESELRNSDLRSLSSRRIEERFTLTAKVDLFLISPDPSKSLVQADTAVVIDVLRASTTICAALDQRSLFVKPCLEPEEAIAYRARSQPETILCGGERHAVQIPGFELGNSPREYTREKVAGKGIAFTTTNGTRALNTAMRCPTILIGSFVNLTAAALACANSDHVALVCAGTDGFVTAEDVLAAGAICDSIQRMATEPIKLNDEAQVATMAWQSIALSPHRDSALLKALRSSRGGLNLLALGFDLDIEFAASVDRYAGVPQFDHQQQYLQLRPEPLLPGCTPSVHRD
jgi:2-phosphosulfolactate phosphatase